MLPSPNGFFEILPKKYPYTTYPDCLMIVILAASPRHLIYGFAGKIPLPENGGGFKKTVEFSQKRLKNSGSK
jgi:hypothetical protein